MQELSRRVVGCSEKDQDSSSGRAVPSYCRETKSGLVETTNVCLELRMNLLVLKYVDTGLVGCAAVGCRASIKNYGCADMLCLSNLTRSQIDQSEQSGQAKAERKKTCT